MEDLLRSRAAANGGYLSRAELLDLGNDDRDIQAAVASGLLVRLRRGAYAFAETHSPLSAEDKHRVLARAIADRLGPSVALSHASACVLHGIAVHDVDLDVVHVTRLDGGAGRREAKIAHHVGQMPVESELVQIDGRLVSSPARAVWEASAIGTPAGALVSMDSALRQGLDPEALQEMASRYSQWQGARRAGLWVRVADGRSESPGESLVRYMCFEHKLPQPTLQYEIHDPTGALIGRTDEAWLEYAHVGEFDGRIKYQRLLRPGESASDVVVREKSREDAIRREGFGVSRFVWSEVLPGESKWRAERLRRELEQSRRLHLRNRSVIPL